MLLPETTREAARIVGEKIRRLVERHDFSTPEHPDIETVTLSVGISSFFDDAESSEKMITQAGAALRQAQEEGGNRSMTLNKVLS